MHATTDRLPSSKATIFYPPSILEEELKNRVAVDWFSAFDCSHILGKVDFCAAVPATDLPLCDAESVLWAEAKRGADAPLDFALVQLILTIGKERTFDRHLPPKYLAAFNAARIAFIPYSEVVEIFYQNDFNWNVAPSDHETREFGDLYQRWRERVMPTILVPDWAIAKKNGIIDADFYLADIFSSDNAAVTDRLNVLLMNDHYRQSGGTNALGFQLFSEISFSDGQKAHHLFWNRYKRPPRKEYWNYIVNRRDLLVPQDVRERKGSFFTPQQWVSLSQDYLAAVLGENWQDDHYVWDCCGGTGNLEVGLTNRYNVWVSTLDQQDVDVIHERIKLGATLLDSHVFQFDFLNDSFDKLPQGLKEIVSNPEKRKRLVIYINPPYAEAGDIRQRSGTGQNKTDVSVVHATYNRYLEKIGIAGRELFAQFFMRIHDEIPGCVLAEFSKLKHLQSPNFKAFRQAFHGKLEKCFIVPADTFDNVKGDFPIGFFVWRLGDIVSITGRLGGLETGRNIDGTPKFQDSQSPRSESNSANAVFTSTMADVYDRKGEFIGMRTILSYDDVANIGKWVNSFRHDTGINLGFMSNGRNDFQNTKLVYFINDRKQLSTPRGWWITPPNLIPMCIFVAVRHSVEATWLNDRDTFLSPNDKWRDDTVFQIDCMIYTIFSDFNVIKSSIGINHWIPFTEEEVGARDCFKSHFMSDFLAGKVVGNVAVQGDFFNEAAATEKKPLVFSVEAQAVMDAGRELWRYYHAQPNANPNASFYDIRLYFQGSTTDAKGKVRMNNESADAKYTALIGDLRAAMKKLARCIEPKVYQYGFLKV